MVLDEFILPDVFEGVTLIFSKPLCRQLLALHLYRPGIRPSHSCQHKSLQSFEREDFIVCLWPFISGFKLLLDIFVLYGLQHIEPTISLMRSRAKYDE